MDRDGALALMSGWTGVDLSKLDQDAPISELQGNAIQFTAKAFSSADPDKIWTVREIAEYAGIGGDGPVIVGSPATVADTLQEWQADTGLDGFNLASSITHPGHVPRRRRPAHPELQRRGVYTTGIRRELPRNSLVGGKATRLSSWRQPPRPCPRKGVRMSTAHIVTTEAEAIDAARTLAARFREGAAERDRDRRLPWAELDEVACLRPLGYHHSA